MEPKFKVGDRVKVKAHGCTTDGMTGTVLESDSMPYIRFDVKSDGLHNCNGLCEDGYGYAVKQSKLTKIRSKKQKTTETTKTMEAKFKVGDRVIIESIPNCTTSGPGWVVSMDQYIGKTGTIESVLDSKYHGFHCYKIVEFSTYSFREDWLTPIGELSGVTIPVGELKRIYDVACGPWQKKIESMVSPFKETVFVSEEKIEEMLKASTSTQKPVVEDVFNEYVKKSKPEFFNFGSEHTLDLTSSSKPIYIRNGLANYGYEGREIGLSGNYTPILVDKEGNETELTSSHYLKFKIKK